MSHFSTSVFKSIIRLIALLILFLGTSSRVISIFAILFMFAEGFGIAEEFFDKRKEE